MCSVITFVRFVVRDGYLLCFVIVLKCAYRRPPPAIRIPVDADSVLIGHLSMSIFECKGSQVRGNKQTNHFLSSPTLICKQVLLWRISALVRYIIIITFVDEVIELGYVFSMADADNAKFQIESQQEMVMETTHLTCIYENRHDALLRRI